MEGETSRVDYMGSRRRMEVSQREEAGDRLTSRGNPTRPLELHSNSSAKNKIREASSADKTTYTQALHTEVVGQ